MDFASPPEVSHFETGVKVDYVIVIMCHLTGYILAIQGTQEGLRRHNATALILHYCAFFTQMPRRYILVISPSPLQSWSKPCVVRLAMTRPSV